MPVNVAVSRRQVIAAALATGLRAAPDEPRLRVAMMSKFLQFLSISEMVSKTKELGFDGIDLCIRPGAHVVPERVEDDLPRAADIIRKAGLDLSMITSSIVDTSTPHAEKVLKTASSLGVRHYRWGGFSYDRNRGIPEQIEALKPRVRELTDMNKRYKMCAMYHIHSGLGLFGASVWDLWLLLRDFDPEYAAINYDVGHATVEGGYGGWRNSFRLAAPFIRGIALKDFKWGKDSRGRWAPQWSALGEGMVNFREFLPMVKAAKFSGPLQLHFEYPLGGVEVGATRITIPAEEAFNAMRRELGLLRQWLGEARL